MSTRPAVRPPPLPPDLAVESTPSGGSCAACGAIVERLDRYCPACHAEQAAPISPGEPAARRAIECRSCGARVVLEPNQRSVACPFCDSNYVVEQTPASRRQPPEYVVGFAIPRPKAEERFRAWLGEGGWFQPGDLASAKVTEKLRGIYLPFWTFSMLADSDWEASIGEYWYTTETYTVMVNGRPQTRTRRVQHTEWWPLAGHRHAFYSGYLVSASRRLEQGFAEQIQPFRLEALKRYTPEVLAGWSAEEYAIEREEAQAACRTEFEERAQRDVLGFLPGDAHREVSVRTSFDHITSDLILLPVYVASYHYGERVFHFVMNGQTGRTAGDKPISSARVGVAATMVGLLVIVAVIAYWWLNG